MTNNVPLSVLTPDAVDIFPYTTFFELEIGI